MARAAASFHTRLTPTTRRSPRPISSRKRSIRVDFSTRLRVRAALVNATCTLSGRLCRRSALSGRERASFRDTRHSARASPSVSAALHLLVQAYSQRCPPSVSWSPRSASHLERCSVIGSDGREAESIPWNAQVINKRSPFGICWSPSLSLIADEFGSSSLFLHDRLQCPLPAMGENEKWCTCPVLRKKLPIHLCVLLGALKKKGRIVRGNEYGSRKSHRTCQDLSGLRVGLHYAHVCRVAEVERSTKQGN